MTGDAPNPALQVLALLGEIELLVADLYRGFAGAFPEDRALWEAMAAEEEVHAALVESLRRFAGPEAMPFASGKINLASLGTYKKGLEYHMGRLRQGGLNRRSALFIARDLEKTLVERAFYEFVESDDPEIRAIRGRIEGETEGHLGRLEEHIAKAGL